MKSTSKALIVRSHSMLEIQGVKLSKCFIQKNAVSDTRIPAACAEVVSPHAVTPSRNHHMTAAKTV